MTKEHSAMADIIYHYFGEDNNWYENHKWDCVGSSNDEFSIKIEETLKTIYDKLINYGKQTKMDAEKIKEFRKIRNMFGMAQIKRDIMSTLRERFRGDSSNKIRGNNMHILFVDIYK